MVSAADSSNMKEATVEPWQHACRKSKPTIVLGFSHRKDLVLFSPFFSCEPFLGLD